MCWLPFSKAAINGKQRGNSMKPVDGVYKERREENREEGEEGKGGRSFFLFYFFLLQLHLYTAVH